LAKYTLPRRIIFLSAFLVLSGAVYAVSRHLPFPLEAIALDTALSQLPLYAGYSLLRMSIAYVFSFFFSVLYGYFAATSPKAEPPLVALLDILQSIPILGFFPVAVLFFVNLFNGSRLGVEVASIFLIFTSMSWNMAFSTYESFKTMPKDLTEAAGALGLCGWQRFIKALFPICIPKLIYSSMISWAGGWYFLIAAEIIAIGPIKHALPGLGSFLIHSTESGRIDRTLLGLLFLISIIVAFNFFIWRPLSVWGDRFRYEFSAPSAPHSTFALQWYWKLHRLLKRLPWPGLPPLLPSATGKASRIFKGPVFRSTLKALAACTALLFLYALVQSLRHLASALSNPLPSELGQIPFALLASFSRLTLAYFIALAWTLPLTYWLGKHPRALRVVTPIAEIGAAIPAPALFPFIILFAIHVVGGMNGAAILLILTGMQWYLLFNLIGGVQSIPGDLKEAAASLGVSRWQYWKCLYLPAVFPSLVTGSITAWGGGWNALIVSEYVVYRGKIHAVSGIGAMLDRATYETGNEQMILFSLLAMVLTITFFNRFFWRKLYLYAVGHFKLEH